jgi:hypothetical protein
MLHRRGCSLPPPSNAVASPWWCFLLNWCSSSAHVVHVSVTSLASHHLHSDFVFQQICFVPLFFIYQNFLVFFFYSGLYFVLIFCISLIICLFPYIFVVFKVGDWEELKGLVPLILMPLFLPYETALTDAFFFFFCLFYFLLSCTPVVVCLL